MSKLKQYMDIAIITAFHSHDEETYVGCVIINDKREIVSKGVNQFVDGVNYTTLPRKRPNKHFYIQHAEARALYLAARQGKSVNRCVAVCTHSPCLNCARALFQSGIDTIYFKEVRKDLDNLNYLLDLKGNLRKLKNGYYKLTLLVRK